MSGRKRQAMANSRLEELRRRAQERIQQVRESMERGEEVAPAEPPAEPARAQQRPTSSTAEAYRAGPAQQSMEGPSLEGPGLEVERPRPAETQPQRRASRAEAPAAPQQTAPPPSPRQREAAPAAHHRGRHSSARQVVNRETLRQAILATEILGKPVSLRPPRENEDL